ncbi:MAG: lipopolysaccharide biosynthesis protein [Gemmatimonadetes bacterium]|nr:lipopolysaccharide biosynthesis protein [Gemmatimonadota bacterium]
MTPPDQPAPVGNIFLEVATSLLQRWRFLLITPVVTVAGALLVTLAMPAQYVTGTMIVPFSGAESRSQIALSQLPAGAANLIGGSLAGSPAERLIGVIIGSRMLNDSIARRVAQTPEEDAEVHRILWRGTRVQRNPDGSIGVQVRASDPKLAARVANAYPAQLNQSLMILSTEGALRKQAFLHTQIDTAQSHVIEAEQRLLDFQQHRSAPSLDLQAQRTIDAAIALQQGIYQQELTVAQLRRTATENNPDLRAALAELESRRGQLKQLTGGTSGSARKSDVFVSMGQSPELRSMSEHLLRTYSQDQRIYESLLAALTDAQIDANNNLPVLTVLDSAMVPDRPDRSWGMTIMFALAGGLLLGIMAALVADGAERMRQDPGNAPFFAAWDRLMSGLAAHGRRIMPARRAPSPRTGNETVPQ